MCTVILPPVINPIAVNKYTIISYGGDKRGRHVGRVDLFWGGVGVGGARGL